MDEIWTQGTSIAATNTARLSVLLAGADCVLHVGEDWDTPRSRCPFCDEPRARPRQQSPESLGPNAREQSHG